MNINTILNVVIIKYYVQFLIKWRCLNELNELPRCRHNRWVLIRL